MKAVDTIFAVLALLLGVYIVVEGLRYGFQHDGTPGAGFFPVCVGLGLAVLSAANVFRALAGLEVLESVFDQRGLVKTVGILVAMAVFIATVHYLGMLLGSAILVVALGFVINPTLDPAFLKYLVPLAVLFPLCAYLLFSVTLDVRLIQGPFGF